MSTAEHYRRLAETAFRLARSSDPDVADSLRALAARYLDKAVDVSRPVVQQQQQIQPKHPQGPEGDGK